MAGRGMAAPISVVVDDLNIGGPRRGLGPLKTYPPLLIDADRVLADPVAFQRFKAVARQGTELAKTRRGIQNLKPLPSLAIESLKRPDELTPSKTGSAFVTVADDQDDGSIRPIYAVRQSSFV